MLIFFFCKNNVFRREIKVIDKIFLNIKNKIWALRLCRQAFRYIFFRYVSVFAKKDAAPIPNATEVPELRLLAIELFLL